jgi:protein-S-isoprenylcysteine O-methyltransferase Ste14
VHDRTLALITLLFFGFELTLALVRRSRRAPGATRSDGGSLRLLWIVITLAITMAVSLSGYRPGLLPFPLPWIRAVALVLYAGGMGLRWWAVITLGKFFTIDVATHDDHALVSTGPFRFVRHPSYTGLLLAFLGFGVSLGNTVSLIVLIAPIAVTLAYRMRVEEAVLRSALGASYEAYCARTKRLIPGVI